MKGGQGSKPEHKRALELSTGEDANVERTAQGSRADAEDAEMSAGMASDAPGQPWSSEGAEEDSQGCKNGQALGKT